MQGSDTPKLLVMGLLLVVFYQVAQGHGPALWWAFRYGWTKSPTKGR